MVSLFFIVIVVNENNSIYRRKLPLYKCLINFANAASCSKLALLNNKDYITKLYSYIVFVNTQTSLSITYLFN